jgi:hypothetical protein
MFCKQEEGFWEFQRKHLAKLGHSLNNGELAKAVVVEILGLALNPLNTSHRIARKIARKIKGRRDARKT